MWPLIYLLWFSIYLLKGMSQMGESKCYMRGSNSVVMLGSLCLYQLSYLAVPNTTLILYFQPRSHGLLVVFLNKAVLLGYLQTHIRHPLILSRSALLAFNVACGHLWSSFSLITSASSSRPAVSRPALSWVHIPQEQRDSCVLGFLLVWFCFWDWASLIILGVLEITM